MTDQEQDPITMYLIVNEELVPEMSLGKVAAQVSHAVGMLHQQYSKMDKRWEKMEEGDNYGASYFDMAKYLLFVDWLKVGIRKVVLKADKKEWEKLKEEFGDKAVYVVDAGITCLKPGSSTVIGLWPMRKSQRSKLLTRLQAL